MAWGATGVALAACLAAAVTFWMLDERAVPPVAPAADDGQSLPFAETQASAEDGPYADPVEMDTEALLAASAAMLLNLPRDPILLPRARDEGSQETASRYLEGSGDLDEARFGEPAAQRLRLVVDVLAQTDAGGQMRLPSRGVDFAYQRALQRQGSLGAVGVQTGETTVAGGVSVLTTRPADRRSVPSADLVLRPMSVDEIGEMVALLPVAEAETPAIRSLLEAEHRGGMRFLVRHVPAATAGGPEGQDGRVTVVAALGPDGTARLFLPSDLSSDPPEWELETPTDEWLEAVFMGGEGAEPEGDDNSGTIRDPTLLDALFAAGTRNGLETDVVNDLLAILSDAVDLDNAAPRDGRLVLLYNDPLGREQRLSAIAYVGIDSERSPMSCYVVADPENGELQCYQPRVGRAYLGDAVFGIPVAGYLTSRFGFRTDPITGQQGRMHAGLDWAAAPGTPVFAAADGVIIGVGVVGGYGNLVQIRHEDGFATRYAHLQSFADSAVVGTPVVRGEVVGFVGSTGRSTGPHLHFEVRLNGEALDPLPFVTAADAGEAVSAPVVATGAGGPSDPQTRAFVDAVDVLLEPVWE